METIEIVIFSIYLILILLGLFLRKRTIKYAEKIKKNNEIDEKKGKEYKMLSYAYIITFVLYTAFVLIFLI